LAEPLPEDIAIARRTPSHKLVSSDSS